MQKFFVVVRISVDGQDYESGEGVKAYGPYATRDEANEWLEKRDKECDCVWHIAELHGYGLEVQYVESADMTTYERLLAAVRSYEPEWKEHDREMQIALLVDLAIDEFDWGVASKEEAKLVERKLYELLVTNKEASYEVLVGMVVGCNWNGLHTQHKENDSGKS